MDQGNGLKPAIAAILILGVTGCGSRPALPAAQPTQVHTPAAAFAVVRRWEEHSATVYWVDSHAAAGVRLRAVRLAGSARPCTGPPAATIRVDGVAQNPAREISIGGRHDLDLVVSHAGPAGGHAVALDLELVGDASTRCVRLPTEAPETPWRIPSPPLALRLGADVVIPGDPLRSYAGALRTTFGIGRFWNPLRGMLSIGPLFAGCATNVCPPEVDGERTDYKTPFGLHLAAELDGYPIVASWIAAGIGVRAITETVWMRNDVAPDMLWVNGAEAVARFSVWQPRVGWAERAEEAAGLPAARTVDIEVPFGIWTTGAGSTRETSWVLGLGVSLNARRSSD